MPFALQMPDQSVSESSGPDQDSGIKTFASKSRCKLLALNNPSLKGTPAQCSHDGGTNQRPVRACYASGQLIPAS
jgi:hypothetical protein